MTPALRSEPDFLIRYKFESARRRDHAPCGNIDRLVSGLKLLVSRAFSFKYHVQLVVDRLILVKVATDSVLDNIYTSLVRQ